MTTNNPVCDWWTYPYSCLTQYDSPLRCSKCSMKETPETLVSPVAPIYDRENMGARSAVPRWRRVACMSLPDPDRNYTAGCALTEGDGTGVNHTHWIDFLTGVEVVVGWHAKGERPRPNCAIRVPGRD